MGQKDLKTIKLDYLIEASLDDQDFVLTMLQLFLKNGPIYLAELKDAYTSKNEDELKRVAHKFKSAIGMMEIRTLTPILADIENAEKTDFPALLETMKKIEYLVDLAKEEISSVLASPEEYL